MSKIIRIAVALILIGYLQNYYFSPGIHGLLNLLLFGGIIYLLYLIIIYFSSRAAGKQKESPMPAPAPKANHAGTNFNYKIIGAFALLAFIYFAQDFLGKKSFAFFLYTDNLVKVSASVSPVLMWGVLGLFAGLVYGCFVAWRKYRLDYKLMFIPIAVFAALVLILHLVNQPFVTDSITNAPSEVKLKIDSTVSVPVKTILVNRWVVTDVVGNSRNNFARNKTTITRELEFKKDGKCYMKENGASKGTLYYTVASDGKSIFVTNPNNKAETMRIMVISIKEDELMLTSKMFQSDTIILKPKKSRP